MIHSFRICVSFYVCFYFHLIWRLSNFDKNSLQSLLSLQNSKRLWISLWQIPPNIIWISKLPSNIWMIIALYPLKVQVVWMFTLNDMSQILEKNGKSLNTQEQMKTTLIEVKTIYSERVNHGLFPLICLALSKPSV